MNLIPGKLYAIATQEVADSEQGFTYFVDDQGSNMLLPGNEIAVAMYVAQDRPYDGCSIVLYKGKKISVFTDALFEIK